MYSKLYPAAYFKLPTRGATRIFLPGELRQGRPSYKENSPFHFLKKRTGVIVLEINLLLAKFAAREMVDHPLLLVEPMQVTSAQNLNYRYPLYSLMLHSNNVLDGKMKSHTLKIIRIRYHLPVIYLKHVISLLNLCHHTLCTTSTYCNRFYFFSKRNIFPHIFYSGK